MFKATPRTRLGRFWDLVTRVSSVMQFKDDLVSKMKYQERYTSWVSHIISEYFTRRVMAFVCLTLGRHSHGQTLLEPWLIGRGIVPHGVIPAG